MNDSALIEPLIRSSCDYSFQTDLSFKSSASTDNTQMIYTLLLPSCNVQAVELCTYYIVIEASNQFLNQQTDTAGIKNASKASYELAASLGILLQFQQKYSYSTVSSFETGDTDTDSTANDNEVNSNKENSDNVNTDVGLELLSKMYKEKDEGEAIQNITCGYHQLYGVKASLTDFPIGIIIQPEFINTDGSLVISQYTSAPDTTSNVKKINKPKGDAESESYDVPTVGYASSEDYILLDIVFFHFDDSTSDNQQEISKIVRNIKYIIYSQANISYIQVAVMNSGGWFLLLILVFLILIALCRKHCCLRNDPQRLSYNDILESIRLQSGPLFVDNNNVDAAGSSNADDQKSIGITSDELNTVSNVEVYHRKLSKMSLNYKKHKAVYKYKACCICLYDYRNGDQIRKLRCNHYFHKQCIDIWFKKNIQCPLCKQYVINARILSKRSNNSDISSSASSSSSATASASTHESVEMKQETENRDKRVAVELDDVGESDEEEDEEEQELMQQTACTVLSNQHTYSLSDSHVKSTPANYSKYRQKHHSSDNHDDLYISRHSNPNIVTRHRNQSQSRSQTRSHSHHSFSSHSSETGMADIHGNQNNTRTTNTGTTTLTATYTVNSSNDVSLSSSPRAHAAAQNEAFSPFEDNKSFMPLSPQINLYIESTFSPSNPKQE
eukprot:CAMPEP_0197078992 /NCGR_PEP_ID=MMETSP1384-20130603/213399_1 /TAXON_ID=29189 /ORGANISM="Ammonia sp." /LENGTH=670 /DNA_ID=CAMNT_0042517861 /DNA_START=25 /DNA_END=2037 /DNA_ORIENTATION=-